MIPRVLCFVGTFPVTPNGKLDRSALRVPKGGARTTASSTIAAASHDEAALLRLWREMLAREDVALHDNFFELGGTSLRAMQLAVRLRREFGATLGVADVLAAPTVASLAPRLKLGEGAWSPLVPLRASGGGAALFLAHPSSGRTVAYHSLLDHLEGPLHALEAAAVLGGRVAEGGLLEPMAARYVEAALGA